MKKIPKQIVCEAREALEYLTESLIPDFEMALEALEKRQTAETQKEFLNWLMSMRDAGGLRSLVQKILRHKAK